ncbi:unnamed protein product [Pleuronectes platessa]|uniref:Uncharacterized protein n=1 Tax=Pleuronectes platessa TaxID=8262 RepID=A0A9N7TJH5_PLEPL|nr:unnamed protein product [Pleuronectes platessa]
MRVERSLGLVKGTLDEAPHELHRERVESFSGDTPRAFTPAVSSLKEALWEKFPVLSAPMFAFVASEPTLLTSARRTNEIGRCVLRCPSPSDSGRTKKNKLIKLITARRREEQLFH